MSEMQFGVKTTQAAVQVKNAGPLGSLSAVIATIGVRDHDGDVVLPGAFTEGAVLAISPWNHHSMTGGALPVGKGIVRTTASEVIVDAELFMANASAREVFEVIQRMGASQEWSWGYRVLDAEPGTLDGQPVQFLKAVHAFEASPVIRGASIGTRTLDAKGREARDMVRRIRDEQLDLPSLRAIRDNIGVGNAARDLAGRTIAVREYVRFLRNTQLAS